MSAKTWDALSAAERERRRAPDGMVWQCGACGKVAEDQYGMIGHHSPGWDEACVLNCVLVAGDSRGGRKPS